MDWRWVEASRGTYYFDIYDDIYAALRARGITPVFSVMFAPSWALGEDVSCNQWASECRYPPGAEHMEAWRALMRRVAQRYPDAVVEVWNEPNLLSFWHSGPDAGRYVELLREARAAVKAVNPRIPVVNGGLNDLPASRGGDVALGPYLRAFYALGGGPLTDALNVHAYPWSLSLGAGTLFSSTLSTVREIRDAADPGRPLWITESGVSTTGSDPRHTFTEAQQASVSVDILGRLSSERDVEAVLFHTLVEPPGSRERLDAGYGMVNRDSLAPKPAYCALRAARGVTGPCGGAVLRR